MLLIEIKIREYLSARALGSLKLLIDGAHAFQRSVGLEQRKDEGEEDAQGHGTMTNLIAREQDQDGDDDGAEEIHDRGGDYGGAHPAHVFAEQAARSLLKLGDFKTFHAEGLDDAVSCD